MWGTCAQSRGYPHSRLALLNCLMVAWQPEREYILDRVRFENECWVWEGTLSVGGYGVAKFAGRQWIAHRFVWTAFVGDLPEGTILHHICDRKDCVNPFHLRSLLQDQHMIGHHRARRAVERLAVHS